MSGYVYLLSNPSMPGLVKIGMTINDPRTRANDLHSTGVPTPFVVEHCVKVDDPYEVEQRLHKTLASSRVNRNREFSR